MYDTRYRILLVFFLAPFLWNGKALDQLEHTKVCRLSKGIHPFDSLKALSIPTDESEENVLLKYFKYDAGQNIFLLLPDYEMIYPTYAQYPYIGLKSEHTRNPRRHILLEFHCCKVFQACVSEPKLYSLDNPPSIECRCPLQRAYVRNEDCLKAYKRKDLYMRIFSLP
ncbi:MAG: hypothetical protein U0V49_00825 [Saprospiraceae bacterium]